MCTRARAQCVTSEAQQWRTHNAHRNREGSTSVDYNRKAKRARLAFPPESRDKSTLGTEEARSNDPTDKQSTNETHNQTLQPDDTMWRGSSSTLTLVEEAFQHHDIATPKGSETSALGYSQRLQNVSSGVDSRQSPASSMPSLHYNQFVTCSMATDLASLLPSHEVVAILVDNYFTKIHWFMLLFHQSECKASLSELYADGHPSSRTARQNSKTAGYTGVLLAVCALSLRYITPAQESRLTDYNVDPQALRERILVTLRLRLLDILALGSLEAVQLCTLLGGYYLYHGEPELAWPLCGCALRLAQALDLHRCQSRRIPLGSSSRISSSQQNIEARKRCWWALHEIETFCSMIYGFPLNMSDADCDIEPLNPCDPWSVSADEQSSSSDQPNLLVYKCAMSDLSKMVKTILEELYGTRQDSSRFTGTLATTSKKHSRLHSFIKRVESLDAQLLQWYSNLPKKLRLDKLEDPLGSVNKCSHLERDTTQTSDFKEQLFQFQALALKLAFENARILIHRPLLSYAVVNPSNSSGNSTPASYRGPSTISSHICRDAALQISWAGHTPLFNQASTTYALSFISLHLLTAGVTLCIMASINPLSQESLETKLGVRRVMEMQMALKADSIIAGQGLEILQRLLSLVMKKETDTLLDIGKPKSEFPPQNNEKQANTTSPALDTNLPRKGHSSFIGERSYQPAPHTVINPSCETPQSSDFEVLDYALAPDYCLDPLMMQAMQDIEQTISYSNASLYQPDNSMSEVNAQTPGYSFIGQDQTWIWDKTLDVERLNWGDDT